MEIADYKNVLVNLGDGNYYKRHDDIWYILPDPQHSLDGDRITNISKINELDHHVEKCKQNLNKSHQIDKNYTNMNAQQAREIAIRVHIESDDSEYKNIKSLIDSEANNGKFGFWYRGSIDKNAETFLKGEGFRIMSFYDSHGGTIYQITW